jgi:formamidopyrimidine-DNA glycosylase
MPELPEVEITRRGLAEHLLGASIVQVIIRNGKLRWPVPANLTDILSGQTVLSLKRRGKYLLMTCGHGTVILHLGMSGSLRILASRLLKNQADETPQNLHFESPAKHDHVDIILNNGKLIRLRDPRRFGAILWHEGDPQRHPLLASLGPEPLEEDFNSTYLYQVSRGRHVSIKQFIMDNHIVVGVGNIYANESLFRCNINPQLATGNLKPVQCEKLVAEIRNTLNAAIHKGGSSLRDFVHSDGSSGYFQQEYFVYGRAGKPCRQCGSYIIQIKQGQRSSFYCSTCQK